MKKTFLASLIAFAFISLGFINLTAAHANDEPSPSEIRSQLFMEAMDNVGVCTPDKAVEVWSKGLKDRNAALPYSVMTKRLEEEYAEDLSKNTYNGNWIIGMSSPWIEKYKITKKEKLSDVAYRYAVKYETATSAGQEEPFFVTLEIIKDGDFWRIAEIKGDEESQAYSGYTRGK